MGFEPMTPKLTYHTCFYTSHLRHNSFRCCSLDYFFTISLDLGAIRIVSTPFMKYILTYFTFRMFNWKLQFSKPSPKQIFLSTRLPFIRIVLHNRFPCDPYWVCTLILLLSMLYFYHVLYSHLYMWMLKNGDLDKSTLDYLQNYYPNFHQYGLLLRVLYL